MLEVRGFRPADVDDFTPLNPAGIRSLGIINWQATTRIAAQSGPAWTGVLDGRPIACAGLSLPWPGRAQAWCLLGEGIPRQAWLAIHRAVLHRLAQVPAIGVWRIDAETVASFEAGKRWLAMLGFRCEGTAERYGPSGEDFSRYARLF